MSDARYTRKKGLFFRAIDSLLSHTFRFINTEEEVADDGTVKLKDRCPWHKLWVIFGLPNLIGLRVDLRKNNLHDTDGDLTQPKVDFSPEFVEDDLVDDESLLKKLQASPTDPVSAYLWGRFSDYAKALLPKLQAKVQNQLSSESKATIDRQQSETEKLAVLQIRSLLVAELNKVLRQDKPIPGDLCKDIQLSPQTVGLSGQNPRGDDLGWLNRWLLEDAYTLELRRNRERKRVCPFHGGPFSTYQRTEDGTMNNLSYPAMGCRFSRLGHNMLSKRPISDEPGLLHPDPLVISERLLSRGNNFKPATTLNLLAGAWIQFQVHDWFSHENEHQDAGRDIRLKPAGSWPPKDMGPEYDKLVEQNGGDMVIPRTATDPTNAFPLNARTPAFRNKDPQWWDASQIYGESVQETLRLRTNPNTFELCPIGQLYLDERKLLPRNENGHVLSGFTDNWWTGTELLHTLFAQEHNAICARLHEKEKDLNDQEIFETARLINCAIMAKIHSVEWTPGIIDHPSIHAALDTNWMGLLGHVLRGFVGGTRAEKTARALAPWLPEGLRDVLTGIPLSEADLTGAPYALSEEFNAVYRLHPLIPDEVPIRRVGQKEPEKSYPMIDIAFTKSRRPLDDGATMDDIVYSFGIANPGQVTIQNYPDFLRKLQVPADLENGRTRDQVLDLAAVDIIRDRERGVPRYNEFRRQLRMPVPNDWYEMSGGRPEVAKALKEIYEDKLEDVDNMVGMFCEKLPEGFGFSDTAFRIFILMASRRLSCDRFFTSDYTAEFYTQTGLDWIAETGMREVIARHHPKVGELIPKGQNPFAPWVKKA